MDEKEFKKLIKKDEYQVFLFCCPAPFPYALGLHLWFVTNNKGKVNRWEVFDWLTKRKDSWGYLNKNVVRPPTTGINKYYWRRHPKWKSKLDRVFSGKKGSLAEEMVKYIENSYKTYPYINQYKFLPGPNSNTYIQWILNKFPNSGFVLGWRSFGKNYRMK